MGPQSSTFAHIYPAPQHVVSTYMRGIGLPPVPRPEGLGICRMLQAYFGELPFYEVG
jgi:hypothetical protein